MKLWLSMILKNEEKNIEKYLFNIYDLFDDVIIIDTWSTDRTIELLKAKWINYLNVQIEHNDKRLIDVRNDSIHKNKCDRVLILDGDEFITREDIFKIKYHLNNAINNYQWYFIKRTDYRYWNSFEDYKMSLINKNYVRYLFSVHACPQVYIRDNGGKWWRINWIQISHYPIYKEYRKNYVLQLMNWINENPWCYRFYRFLWYHYFKQKNYEKSKENLKYIVLKNSTRFPVETLNAYMILSSIYQLEWHNSLAFEIISRGIRFYELVKDDFEVIINFRLLKRFRDNHNLLLHNSTVEITPYEFAY